MNAREASTVRASASSRSGAAASRARGRPRTCSVGHQPARHQAGRERGAQRDAVQQRGEQNPHHAARELVHAHPRRGAADPLGRDVVGHDRLVRAAGEVHAELQQQHRGPQPAQRRRGRQHDAAPARPAPRRRRRTRAGGRPAPGAGRRTRRPRSAPARRSRAPTAASAAYESTACGPSALARSCSTTPSTAVQTTWIPNQNAPSRTALRHARRAPRAHRRAHAYS